MTRQCTEDQFLKDVASHTMEIVRDDGVFRYLRFRKPGTYVYSFNLVTWPGYLAYSGDMGCYVFSRVEDMFSFFRCDRKDGALQINLQYWAEKCQAACKSGINPNSDAIKEYSPDKFREVIAEILNDDEAKPEVREAVRESVLSKADDGEYAAHIAANEFEHDGYRFRDFWERNLREYTYRYIWCCYAIAWGIKTYDGQVICPNCDTAMPKGCEGTFAKQSSCLLNKAKAGAAA